MTNRNKKRLIVSFLAVILLALLIFGVIIPYFHKTKAPISNNNYSEKAKEALEEKNYPVAVENYTKAIESEPQNTNNYVDKSTAEYATGDKEAAKQTVEEGLQQDPNNELLKARLDALEKGTFDNVVEATRE